VEGVGEMTFWKEKTVLVTGHTGFKGSWLSLWLQKLGANVIGYALQPPTEPSLFHSAKVGEEMVSIIGDIKNGELLSETIRVYQPEIVFHLAAQPLVRVSYNDPVDTFAVNVVGTANVLNATRLSSSVRAVVNVTTDKCYDNHEWEWPYRESDKLGGYDPYSSSKACSELVTEAFRKSYFIQRNIQLASARAGNVIGGGDWALDRLVPDVIESILLGQMPAIRNPYATRPWQHVLEPLNGYMLLAERMWSEGESFSTAWNFGPGEESILTVGQLTDMLLKHWESPLKWDYDQDIHPYEAHTLKLDSSKARIKLGWKPKLNAYNTVEWTVDWYKKWHEEAQMKEITLQQIEAYERIRV
jgi:CDP-glucose 4,6-dehydratase